MAGDGVAVEVTFSDDARRSGPEAGMRVGVGRRFTVDQAGDRLLRQRERRESLSIRFRFFYVPACLSAMILQDARQNEERVALWMPPAGYSFGIAYAVTGSAAFTLTGREPAEAVGLQAVGDAEELFGNCLCDLARLPVANHDAVDGADGRDLGGRAGEEDFVGDVEQLARQGLFGDREAEMAGDGQHRVAGDAGERGVGQRRGVENSVAHHEDVLARALAYQAVHVQTDALGIAVDLGFHVDQLRVHVVGAGLGQGGHGVGRKAVPTGDADVRAARAGDVLAPREVGHVDLDGRALGADADFAVAAQGDGADVARGDAVGLDQLDRRRRRAPQA